MNIQDKVKVELDGAELEFIINCLSFSIANLDFSHSPPEEEAAIEQHCDEAYEVLHRCYHKKGAIEMHNDLIMRLAKTIKTNWPDLTKIVATGPDRDRAAEHGMESVTMDELRSNDEASVVEELRKKLEQRGRPSGPSVN